MALLGVFKPVALGYAGSSAFLPGVVAWYVRLFGEAPVLSDNTFSAIVAIVMVTTLVTPPLLKAAFAEPSAANGNP